MAVIEQDSFRMSAELLKTGPVTCHAGHTPPTTTDELEALHEENLSLQSHLEDFENRARRSNLRIPETVTDLQSTATALFQELMPSIPIELLGMDRIHRTLAPHPDNGPLVTLL